MLELDDVLVDEEVLDGRVLVVLGHVDILLAKLEVLGDDLVRGGERRLLLLRRGRLEADGEGRVVVGVDVHLDAGHRD